MVPPAPQTRWEHNNIVVFATLCRYSWYLQRLKCHGNTIILLHLQCSGFMVPPALKCDEKHRNIVVFNVFAMFWRYSWYLPRLKYDAKHNNIVVFAICWR
jgi:hypothetical protein